MYTYILISLVAGAIGVRLFGTISPQWVSLIHSIPMSDGYIIVTIGCAVVGIGAVCLLDRVVEPWGTTFDVVTRQPVDLTLVILETIAGEHVAQMVTDLRGRFAFWVAPGTYRLKIERSHFEFPPRHATVQFDAAYGFYYDGGNIEITQPTVLGAPVPLQQTAYDWNHEKKLTIASGSLNIPLFRQRLIVSHALWTALLVSLVVCIIVPSLMLLAVVGVLIVLMRYRYRWEHFVRPGQLTGNIIPGMRLQVAIIDPKSNVRIVDTTADSLGRYFVLVPSGIYTVQVLSGVERAVVYECTGIDGSQGYINAPIVIQ